MTKAEKLAYIREELERFKTVRTTSTAGEWIALKLSCSVAEAERLIWLAKGRAAVVKSIIQRATRHNGTFYFVGTLLGAQTCGHRHATVRAAQPCRRRWQRQYRNVRVFEAHFGHLPARILD